MQKLRIPTRWTVIHSRASLRMCHAISVFRRTFLHRVGSIRSAWHVASCPWVTILPSNIRLCPVTVPVEQ